MAKLTYADIIERDRHYKMLADLGLRFNGIDTVKLMPRLVELVAPEHLELLAESRSILGADGYWLAESDQMRRRLIKGAYELHRYKGTPWAVREIVRRLGFGEVQIIEGMGNKHHNGEITRDGTYSHGHSDRWAHYRIVMNNVITNASSIAAPYPKSICARPLHIGCVGLPSQRIETQRPCFTRRQI